MRSSKVDFSARTACRAWNATGLLPRVVLLAALVAGGVECVELRAALAGLDVAATAHRQIGRASCRERVSDTV